MNYCIQNICLYSTKFNTSLLFIYFIMQFVSLGQSMMLGSKKGRLWRLRKLWTRVDTLSFLCHRKFGLRRKRYNLKSRQSLSPNIQVCIPNLNANLTLAAHDQFITAKLKLKPWFKKNTCFVFFFHTLNVFRPSGINTSAFTHWLWVDVLYVQNISSSFDLKRKTSLIPHILIFTFTYMLS